MIKEYIYITSDNIFHYLQNPRYLTFMCLASVILVIISFLPAKSFAQTPKKVEIIRANSLEFDERLGINAKRLLGNVVFKHEEAFMFCDSAYFYDAENFVEAFSNVRIIQGDSLLLFGQKLLYNGNTRLAQMRNVVKLIHYDSFLLTDSLDYDRGTEIGYYFNGGTIYHEDNVLSSLRGYYHSLENTYYAVDSVEMVNPQYTIYSDTLKYDTETAISYFFGPTHIVSDSNIIYCEIGYYDTENDVAGFWENAWLESGHNLLKGDSIYYDRKIRFGEAFENVSIYDTVENFTAYGNYGYYYESPHFAMLTDSVWVVHVADEDSLFLSSDTVYISVDTLDNKLIRAFYKVQVFKSDIQARCDSLIYSSADSLAEMYVNPIVWLEGTQLTADFMSMHFIGNDPDYAVLEPNAFVIEPIDSVYFNQIKGEKLIAFFKDKELYKADIYNNSETLYFLEDEETKELIAKNKAISTNMTIYIKDKQFEKIWFYEKPDGQTFPIDDVLPEQLTLRYFVWYEKIRPKSKKDIFIWLPIE